MTLQQILRQIKKHTWWSEESPGRHQTAQWAWHGFVEGAKYFPANPLSIGFFIYKNDFFYEETPADDKLELFYLLARQYDKDPKYIKKLCARWEAVYESMLKDGWKLVKQLPTISRSSLAKKYILFTNKNIDQARYSTLPEAIDVFTEEDLPKLIEKELPYLSATERAEIAVLLSMPPILSFMEKERIALLKGALKVIKNLKEIDQVARQLSKKYFWIKTSYASAPSKLPEDYKRDLKSLIKKRGGKDIRRELKQLETKVKRLRQKQKEILKKYKLSPKLRRFFRMTQEFGAWIDERKCVAMQAVYIIFRILEETGRRLRVPANLLGYCTYKELAGWLGKDKKVSLSELKKRRHFCVYVVWRSRGWRSQAKFITDPKAVKKIFQAFFSIQKVKEFKGTIASAPVPKVKGKISLVLDTAKDRFVPGRILVTTMTRPEFLPLMRRAKAIVTDEGGLTCHAAIISRELGIPCIIGTKIATKVLRDGERVEVDAEKGIVKKLN